MNPFEDNLFKYLTPEQLRAIQAKKIGLGGAGGLGSNIAVLLTRTGFRHFEILDSDRVDYSNLNRQQYFIEDVGQKKVLALDRRLKKINPGITAILHDARWTPSGGEQYFQECDFIVEAFDAAEDKHAFVQFYQPQAPFIISGIGMAGLEEKKPLTVKKMGNVYMAGDLVTGTEQGHPPLAPRVTACAALMAEVILDLTLGLPPAAV